MKNIYFIRLNLCLILLLSTTVIITKDIWFLCGLSVFGSLIAVFILKGQILRRIKPLLFIGLLILLINLLFNYQTDYFSRLEISSVAFIKIYLISLSVFVFTETTSMLNLILALSFLPKEILAALCITFSLIPVILTESEKIQMVQKTKGLENSFFNPLKSFFPVIIPLLHRTLKRAETISAVMSARGFDYD